MQKELAQVEKKKHERPLARSTLNRELKSRVELSPSFTRYWIGGCRFLGRHREC